MGWFETTARAGDRGDLDRDGPGAPRLGALFRRRRWPVAAAALFVAASARAGTTQVMLESGPYEMSVDGVGSSTSSAMSWTLTRPTATSTVHRAFATVSSAWGVAEPGPTCLEVDGIPLTLGQLDWGGVYSRYDDVTSQLSAYLDALPVGASTVPVTECRTAEIDGNGLIVVWEDPSFEVAAVSVTLGSVVTGSNPILQLLTEPMDATATDFQVELGLGISFSDGMTQYTRVDVNGATVAASAGGYDDGNYANGGLYTLGGDGDGPSGERYDVTSQVANGATQLDVNLYGATQDDFLFAAWLWARGAKLDCAIGPDADSDGVTDACDLCPGYSDVVDLDEDGVPDGCDVCPAGDDHLDSDLDGVPDACDVCVGDDRVDSDLDGVPDACDVCVGDDHVDADADGVPDACDVCVGDDRVDSDLDGVPDACDVCVGDDRADTDADGVPDACDVCVGDDHVDSDLDGVPDACDPCLEDSCAPALWYLSPKRGPAGGGVETALIGDRFDPTCVASFDGVDAATTFQGASALLAEPDAHPVGLVDVTVSCANGAATLTGGYTFYDDTVETGVAPELDEVLPNQVDPAGGDVVTAAGAGFAFGAVVRVDGVIATATVIDDTLLSIVTPPHPEGAATVEISNPDGLGDSLDGALLYVGPPGTIATGDTAVEPSKSGQVGGGCSTAPPGGVAALILALVFSRRRSALAALAGCSEYQVSNPAPKVDPPADGALPIAVTGPAVRVKRAEPAGLDGTASYDPAGLSLTYAWTLEDAPTGASATLDDPGSPTPTLIADQLGTYVVSLVVTDGDGQSSVNPASQTVEVGPWQDLRVSLTWDAPVDLDLHLVGPGGHYYAASDCFFGNPTPDWGAPGVATDDPFLATDDDGASAGPGWGPETVALPEPAEGLYTAIVVFWNDRGLPTPTAGTLTVEAEGRPVAEEEIALEQSGDAILVGTLDWTSLGWTPDGSATTHDALGGPPFNGG